MPLSLNKPGLLLACLALACQAVAAQPPNIVLIVVDDIGFSDFGAFGGEIDTPTIDALAAAGVRFSNFHAAASCAPTRAMLMTGLDHHLAGIGSMRELMPLSHRGEPGYGGVLSPDVTSIAERLQAAGYNTSVAGKWHLGDEPRNLPPSRGFDYSVIQADSGSDNFEMRPYLPMKPEAYWYENGRRMTALPEDFYSSSYFVDKTIEFLERHRSDPAPFFSYVAFQANHTPLQAPARFVDHYRGRYTEGWAEVQQKRIERVKSLGLIDSDASVAQGPTQADWDALSAEEQYFEARRMQAYAGMATAMDYEVGRLLDYLRRRGWYENTVFVLFSDNGAVANEPYQNRFARRWLETHYHREVEKLGERGSWVAAGSRWGLVANTPLSGYKFYAAEGGVRVPLIIAGLPSVEQGSVFKAFSYVTDVAPTLLEIAGLDPGDLSAHGGRSLLSALRGDEPGSERGAVGYEFSGNAALYQGAHKLVRNRPPVGDGQWRLHNIDTDPGERIDLAEQMPNLYRAMRDEYAAYVQAVGVLPMPDNYSMPRQVAINALLFVFLPRYAAHILSVVLILVAASLWFYRRASRRH